MTRIMVLGAGLFQLSGISRAVDLDLEVLSVDNVPSNPGHRIAHRSVNLSTTDVRGVVAAATDLKVEGIITFSSDVAVESVAAVADKLGLPGPPRDAVRSLSNKARFRLLQRENEIEHPPFEVLRNWTATATVPTPCPGTVVVKPADSSGSRGVSIVHRPQERVLSAAIANARECSRSGDVVIEGFLGGTEVGGDAFLIGGRIARLFVTEKRLDGVLVSGHCYPNRIVPRRAIDAIRVSVERCCSAAGLTDGPLNFDVMLDGDSATVIEMSPRTGGNGIPQVIREVEGVDVEALAVHFSVGDGPSLDRLLRPTQRAPSDVRVISHVLTAPSGGKIEGILDGASHPGKDSRVREAWIGKSAGESLSARGSRSEPFGYLIARLEGDDELSDSILDPASWVRLSNTANPRSDVSN